MKKIILALITSLLLNVLITQNSQAFENDVLLDPAGVMMWVDMPRKVSLNEEFAVLITIKNTNTNELEIDDIDIGKSFINHFELKSITPTPSELDKSDSTYTFEYPLSIESGESVDLKLKLKALKPGAFIGDIDAWIGDEFLTRYAQCEVIP